MDDPIPAGSSNKDCFAPPAQPCECYCLHCGRVFMSDQIWFQKIIGGRDDFAGFWMCPTSNCDGAGFTFDIFPTDPDHPANAGWVSDEDDEEAFEEELAEESSAEEWDPDEPKYAELDEEFVESEEDDIEGEQWKLGLQPGEVAPPVSDEQMQLREQEKKYDEPDERPRILDWSDRKESGEIREDDIPY